MFTLHVFAYTGLGYFECLFCRLLISFKINFSKNYFTGTPDQGVPGHVAQSVTCLAANVCLYANSGVTSLMLVRYFHGD